MTDLGTPYIEMVDISRLEPYEKNAKKHDKEQIIRLSENIKRYGFDQPIVVWPIPGSDKLSIIKGHGRREALLHLGIKKAPVIIHKGITKEKADALRIADNALSSINYDTRMLAEESSRLLKEFDMDALDFGFSKKDEKIFIGEVDLRNIDLLVKDVSSEMSKQKEEDAERVKEVDNDRVRLQKIFGVKDVSGSEARTLNLFLATVEGENGLEGMTSLLKFAEDYISK